MKATMLRGIVLGTLTLALAACSPASVVSQLAPQVQARLTSPMTAIAAQQPAPPSSATAAIQQVIQRGNAEQVQAIASQDASVMRDTSTDSYYQDLAQTNQDLLDSGVTKISLDKIEWGPVTVTGATASATSYETWTTVYSDGTTDQSRDRNVYTLVQQNGVWKIQADEHPDDGFSPAPASSQPATTLPSPQTSPAPAAATGRGQSHNWSGYSASGGKFTGVNATWTVPQVTSTGSLGTDAAWVGIGGVSSHDLIQAGTEATVLSSGRTQYQAWIELLPQVSHPVPLAVAPGNSVTVAINQQTGGDWQISFKNNTTGATYDRTVQYDSSLSSAEWVEEAPSAGRGVLPLDNFGSVTFSGASAVKDGKNVNLTQAGARPITMIGSGNQPLATPSVVIDGSGFTVTRTANSAATGAGGSGARLPRGGRPSL